MRARARHLQVVVYVTIIAFMALCIFPGDSGDERPVVSSTETSEPKAVSCGRVSIGSSASGIMCGIESSGAVPAVVAVSGWNSDSQGTSAVCSFFAQKGWACVSLDSAGDARSEEFVVSEINQAVDYLKAQKGIDSGKIMFWGGSNGALTTLLAASQRDDVYAVASTSPPLFYRMDKRKFPSLSNLKTHLIYVFGGEQDYTDEETAKALVGIVVSNGKKGEYHIIPGAGHEICCGDARVLDLQYEFLKGLIDGKT